MKQLISNLIILIGVIALFACNQAPAPATPFPTPTATNAFVPALPSPTTTRTLAPTLEPHTATPTTPPTVTPIPPTVTPAPTRLPCSPATEGPLAGIDPHGQKIIWWHTLSGSREKSLKTLVASFNRSNECGITVEAKYAGNTGEIGNKVATAIRNNTLPAIVVGYPSDAARYQQSDKVVDVNPYVNDPAWGLTAEQVADIYPALWEQSAHPELGGQRLGVAYTRSMEVMFYNKTWAAELGFDHAPTTPAEFEEQACKAAQSTGGKGGYVLRDNASAVAAWTFAFGGNLLDENGSYAFSSPAAVEALTMLKRMYDNGCAYFYNKTYPDPELTKRHALFTQGSSAGLWSYEEGMEEAKRGDEFEVLALPHTTVNPRMNAYGMDFLVAKSTPEQQLAAWVFIKWFLTPETQAEWVKISDYFPIGYSAYAYLLDYMDANPHWEETADLLPYTTYEPSLATYQDLRSEISRAFNSIIKGDGSNIQAVMDALTEKANQR